MSTDIGIWVAGILTLAIMSFLYKDNPLYKIAESIFIGVSTGYWAVYTYFNVIDPILIGNIQKGQWSYIFAGILGVLILARLLPNVGWISRWPLAFIIGITAGMQFTAFLESNVMEQITASIVPLNNWDFSSVSKFLACSGFKDTFITVGVISILIYFFFSKEHKGAFGGTAKVGILFLMVSFGASFGNTVMARISLLIGRMDFLLKDWLGLIQ